MWAGSYLIEGKVHTECAVFRSAGLLLRMGLNVSLHCLCGCCMCAAALPCVRSYMKACPGFQEQSTPALHLTLLNRPMHDMHGMWGGIMLALRVTRCDASADALWRMWWCCTAC